LFVIFFSRDFSRGDRVVIYGGQTWIFERENFETLATNNHLTSIFTPMSWRGDFFADPPEMNNYSIHPIKPVYSTQTIQWQISERVVQ
jgi:hypothetical protein